MEPKEVEQAFRQIWNLADDWSICECAGGCMDCIERVIIIRDIAGLALKKLNPR